MKKLMVCPKKSGNIYKCGHQVSENSDTNLLVIEGLDNVNLSEYDVIILSSGVYGGHVHKRLQKWMLNNQLDTIKKDAKIYLFLTWIGRKETDKQTFENIKNTLASINITLEDSYMKCYGNAMRIIRRSHPNQEDFESVLLWVKDL